LPGSGLEIAHTELATPPLARPPARARDHMAALDPWLDGADLLIADNLSSLTAVIRDNDAESWGPIQDWLLRLRRRGMSGLIVHHAGKGGQQRGTSRREEVLDGEKDCRKYRQAAGAIETPSDVGCAVRLDSLRLGSY
jgi:putative DNA primase/helicase